MAIKAKIGKAVDVWVTPEGKKPLAEMKTWELIDALKTAMYEIKELQKQNEIERKILLDIIKRLQIK